MTQPPLAASHGLGFSGVLTGAKIGSLVSLMKAFNLYQQKG